MLSDSNMTTLLGGFETYTVDTSLDELHHQGPSPEHFLGLVVSWIPFLFFLATII